MKITKMNNPKKITEASGQDNSCNLSADRQVSFNSCNSKNKHYTLHITNNTIKILSVKNTLHEQKNLSFAGQDERSRAGFY